MSVSLPSRCWSISTVAMLQLVAVTACAQVNDKLAIYVADLKPGKVALVTDEPLQGHSYCGSPNWSPDGKRFLIDATPGREWSKTRILACDFPLPDPPKFTDLGPGNCPSWSPDGKQIALLLNQNAVPGAQPGIYLMDAEGKNRRRLGGFGVPEWSPDGKQILTISFESPPQLALIDVASGKEQPLPLADYTIQSLPGWAGDSQTLISVVRGDGPSMLALVDLATPAAARIKEVLWTRGQGTEAEPLYPTISAATKRIAFAGRTPKGTSLLLLESKTSLTPKAVEPDRYDPMIASLAISPDGQQLLFCSRIRAAAPAPAK